MLISAMGLHAGSQPDEDTILQYCSKIGLSIESGMFAQAQSQIVSLPIPLPYRVVTMDQSTGPSKQPLKMMITTS